MHFVYGLYAGSNRQARDSTQKRKMDSSDCNGADDIAAFVMADGAMDVVFWLIFSAGKQNGISRFCWLNDGGTVSDC